jgi:hypothetical protein
VQKIEEQLYVRSVYAAARELGGLFSLHPFASPTFILCVTHVCCIWPALRMQSNVRLSVAATLSYGACVVKKGATDGNKYLRKGDVLRSTYRVACVASHLWENCQRDRAKHKPL